MEVAMVHAVVESRLRTDTTKLSSMVIAICEEGGNWSE